MSETIRQYLMVLLTAMIPVAELRAAVPAGIAMDLQPWRVLAVSVVGNLIPVPFIILFIRRILLWLKKWGGAAKKAALWAEQKADRAAELFYRYELLGLFILVAIPLPGTGAWTGALVAAMLRVRMKAALPVIAAGVLAAGVIVLCLSCGVSALAT